MDLQSSQALNNLDPSNRFQGKGDARLAKVGKQFESMFMYQVLELMKPKVDEDSLFYGGKSEEMFRQVLNEHIADAITEKGGLGIKETVEAQIQKYREAVNK